MNTYGARTAFELVQTAPGFTGKGRFGADLPSPQSVLAHKKLGSRELHVDVLEELLPSCGVDFGEFDMGIV